MQQMILVHLLVQFSINDVERWEKAEYDQLSSNSIGKIYLSN